MDRTFNLTLDVAKPIDPANTFRIFRGDNVTFNFTFKNGENDFDTSSAVKARVYAKRVYADGVKKLDDPIFSGEFTTITSATFTSAQTAGDAANYLMAVILLDANNNLITAQGIFFDLIENGYAGYYQPAQDFRDEVLDALAQAQQAATNAATSASNAAQSATSAQASLSAGENLYQQGLQAGNAILADCNSAKAAAASSAQSAEASAGIAAQQASDAESAKDAAVDAANTATQAAGVQDLKQSKTERGTYYINGGTITSAAFALSAPFTYFITYKAGFVGNLFAKGNTSLTVAASGTLTLTDGTNTATATMDATKDHLIAVEVLTTSANLIIDGIATTPTTFAFVDTASAGVVIGGTTTDGKLARPILFNFGISEINAPYTFADYQSGKALSPYLTNAIAKVEDSNLGASTDGGWDITANPTSTITKGKWTANSGTSISYLKNRTIGSAETAAGIDYAIDLRSASVLGGGGCLFYNDNALTMYNTGKAVIRAKFKYLKITAVGGTSPYTGITIAQTTGQNDAIIHLNNGSVTDHNWHEYSQILTANTNKASNANGARIGLSAGGLDKGETGASWSIADFHFEILGALFAPADFVITTGTTRNIPDLSGQGKDATLSGQPATVKTDNDIKVAKLKEYFTANT